MKKTVSFWQMIGFLFTSILGTFLHFLFDLTDGSVFAALISAVNESIWEHMKLLFYPMVLFAMLECRAWGKNVPGFWCVKGKGILLGLVLIPVLYYTYTGILGISADWFNIAIFFLAAGIAFRWETKAFQKDTPCQIPPRMAVGMILLLALAFTLLTFLPPEIPFFCDPVTGTYGFE